MVLGIMCAFGSEVIEKLRRDREQNGQMVQEEEPSDSRESVGQCNLHCADCRRKLEKDVPFKCSECPHLVKFICCFISFIASLAFHLAHNVCERCSH